MAEQILIRLGEQLEIQNKLLARIATSLEKLDDCVNRDGNFVVRAFTE